MEQQWRRKCFFSDWCACTKVAKAILVDYFCDCCRLGGVSIKTTWMATVTE